MTGAGDSIRAFVALSIPATAKLELERLERRLAAQITGGVRWVDPAGMHLTLKFLGNVEPALVDDIIKAVRSSATGVSPFSLHLAGLGMFPNERRPRVLWAGLQGDLDSLRRLQEKLEAAMSGLGFSKERRPFSPHLTLGRLREPAPGPLGRRIASAVASSSLEPTGPWRVERVHLVRSTLAHEGATYTDLGSATLGIGGSETGQR